MVPLLKKKGGIRPLAIGEILKLVASKVVVGAHGADVVEGLHPAQVGVTPAHGTLDAAVLTAQSWAAKVRNSAHYHILKVDVYNAYNAVRRVDCLHGAQQVSKVGTLDVEKSLWFGANQFLCETGV